MIKLEDYIAELREQGTESDAGEFSLNFQSAKGRLAQLKLLREMGWASILLQAAVRWNCWKFEVRQTRYLTRFVLPLEKADLPSTDEILHTLSQINLSSDTGLVKFVMAVQILLHQGRFPFQVKICQSAKDVETLAYGELTWFDRFRKLPANSLVLDINHAKPISEHVYPIFAVKREQMAIRRELEIYGTPSPILVSLDGRDLQGRFSLSEMEDKGQRILCGLQLLSRRSSRLANLPLAYALQKAIEKEPLWLLTKWEHQGFFSISLRLPSKEDARNPEPARRCYLSWVQHGVVVESIPLDFPSRVFCFDLYLSGEGLETDLTGSQLIRNEAFGSREQTALCELQKALRIHKTSLPSAEALSQIETRDHQHHHPIIGSALFLTVFAPLMAAGTLLSILFIPYVGIPMVGAGYLGYKHQPFKVKDEELLKSCGSWLETDYREFLKFLKV